MKFGAGLVWIAFWVGTSAIAAPQAERTLESTRSFGKGRTFVAAPDSDDAIRQNVATLADEHKMAFQLRWFEGDLFVGENSLSTLNDLLSLDFTGTTPVKILQSFSEKFGEQQYARIQAGTAMRIYSFEISPFFRSTNWLDLRVPSLPEAWFYSSTMFGMNIGLGLPMGKNFRFGVTMRPFSSLVFDKELAYSDILDFEPLGDNKASELFKFAEGSGIAWDFGLIWNLTNLTRLGLSVDDVGYTSYMLGEKNDPELIRQKVNLGLHSMGATKPWRFDWALDFQDITNPDGLNILRLTHIGFEFGRSYLSRDNDMGVTAGFNEGYLTTGAFINLYIFRFDMANYGVELGEAMGQRQDRRWGFSLKTSLDV